MLVRCYLDITDSVLSIACFQRLCWDRYLEIVHEDCCPQGSYGPFWRIQWGASKVSSMCTQSILVWRMNTGSIRSPLREITLTIMAKNGFDQQPMDRTICRTNLKRLLRSMVQDSSDMRTRGAGDA